MSVSGFARFWLTAPIVTWMALQGGGAQSQVQTQEVQPVNSGANPYRTIRDWGMGPEGRPFGGSNGVAIDRDGRSVWVADRCSGGINPGCLGTTADPINKFDESGKRLRSFGGGMFVWPHGLHVDRDGNVWVADSRTPTPDELKKFPGEKPKGSVVVKFSPEGKVLLTLGTPGVVGNPPKALTDPTNVLTDANGDIYVSESHTNVEDPNLVGRISVFDRNGKFLRTIGKTGTGPGEFRTPHALVFDSQGRLIVADRHNHRVQILTKEGKYIGEYREFSRVSGLAIDRNDTLYAADSESDARRHPGWRKGIRIGSLKDGKVTTFIPPHPTDAPEGAMGEGIALDAAGNLYTAEATVRGVTKYVIGDAAAQQPPRPPVGFFVTSSGSGTGDLGGLAGADQRCQALAKTAGAGNRTWRAYLSTSGPGGVNARDRIGAGPWYNVKGALIAQGVADLHSDKANINNDTALDEQGRTVNSAGAPNRHDILTGSTTEGRGTEMTCQNWTSSSAGAATLGHHDRLARGTPGSPWNSAHASQGCSQENLRATGGAGLFYCFAAN